MFVIIKDNNIIKRFNLNEDIKYNGISIYTKKDKYYIDLKEGLYFSDYSKSKELEIIEYSIVSNKFLYTINVFVYDDDYDDLNKFSLYENKNFIIANNDKANIVCYDEYLKNYYCSLINGYINTNYEVIVNGNKYIGQLLKDGDVVEYLGIVIHYYQDFLYINSLKISVKLERYSKFNAIVKYKNIETSDEYYMPNSIDELVVEDIDEYIQLNKQNNFELVKNMLPNLVMCLSMSLMAYLNYINNPSGNVAVYLIMPISMFLTSILIPIVFIVISNNKYKKEEKINIDKYIEYLNKYKETLQKNIDKYIDSLNSHYFELFNAKKKMFYATKKSDDYLLISVGKILISKDIVIKKTNNDDINKILIDIENRCNNIDDYPLFVDLKNNKIITIISKDSEREYYFNRFLLEVSYKHHYDDIYIAVYAKSTDIINKIYNLPHLFFNNKRLTLDNEQDLQILDQMNLDRPLVLFIYDKVKYDFTNESIHLIYFSNDVSDIYKDSDCNIQYISNYGYLYLNGKQKFKSFIEDVDFNNYFNYLGSFENIEKNNDRYKFIDVFSSTIKDYYLHNDYSLKAKFAYNDSELICFDLHESKQGPHGLIGGSTGSGKSELIVSMLLSLCIRYAPNYLNIVLIDYKGGGIKESLSYMGRCIPHIVASVSNLENNSLERLIIALKNECKLRQQLFKELSNICNTSIMNLDDYLTNNRYFNMVDIAHEIIVVDEFAELKKENPEQIKELISISRIGRSLGIHLILATQKPSGVIDEEIWSNSRFKLALKVFDEKDSLDIIKSKDAAYLNNPGSFYMRVDGGLIKGQSMYAKSDVYNKDPYQVTLLDNSLNVIKTYKKQENNLCAAESYYSKQIIDTCGYMNIKTNPLEYMPPISIERKRMNSFMFGIIDDYYNNINNILTYDLKDNILIYSTRSNEINGILNTLNENEVKTVVIGSKVFKGEYILDSLEYDDYDDIEYLFKYIFSNNHNDETIVIEDVSSFLTYDEIYLDYLCKLLRRKDKLHINLICLSSSSQISYRLINIYVNKILININDINDVSTIYGMRSKYKGNSYYFNEEPITFIPNKIEKYNDGICKVESIIKRIPEIIKPEELNNKYLLGYDQENKDRIYGDKDILIISCVQEYLNIYSNSYSNCKTILYKYDLKVDSTKPILWLGPGVFNQRLFVTGLRDDIKNNQGIYIENNSIRILRRLTDA